MKLPADRRTGGRIAIRIAVGISALAAIVGQGVIYFGGDEQSALNVGMPTVIVAGLFAGAVYGIADWRANGVDHVDPPKDSFRHDRTGGILTYTVVELVAGELLGLLSVLLGSSPIALGLAIPLLFGGLFSFVAALAGSLIVGLVVWPLYEVVISGERAVRGRPVNRRILATALVLLTVVAFAVFLTLSSHVTAADAAPRQRGIVMIARLFVDYSGGAANQIEAWIARALFLALAGETVWAFRAVRKQPSP